MRVSANSKKESLVKKSADHFELSVKEKAERNMANKRVVEVMARFFNVPVGKTRIISGHHSQSKIISIDI